MNIITQIIIALIIMALMVMVAYLKSQLNIANYNMDVWRQLAINERAKNDKV